MTVPNVRVIQQRVLPPQEAQRVQRRDPVLSLFAPVSTVADEDGDSVFYANEDTTAHRAAPPPVVRSNRPLPPIPVVSPPPPLPPRRGLPGVGGVQRELVYGKGPMQASNAKLGGRELIAVNPQGSRMDQNNDSIRLNKSVKRARERFQVTLGERICFATDGVIDSATRVRAALGNNLSSKSMPAIGRSLAGETFVADPAWLGSMIWVCAVEPERNVLVFYTGVGRIHQFHHSTFTGGGDVIAAGEWTIESGRLTRIAPLSGHYRPTLQALYRAVLHMAPALVSNPTVYLYDAEEDKWVDVPVRRFLEKCSDNGRYHPHPDAAPMEKRRAGHRNKILTRRIG